MSITHIYNIGIPKHKNTYDFLVQVRNFFYYLWVKRFFDIRRAPQSNCADFSICHTPITWGARSTKIRLASPSSQSELTDFSQIFQNPPRTLPAHDVIHIHFPSGNFILTSVNYTSSPRVRQHLLSSLHLTNPCAKRKVLSLTKPKGRIYKTKSLGHYITERENGTV